MSELKLIGNVRKRTLTIGVPVYECMGAVEISDWRAIAAFNKAAAGAVTDILTTKRVPGVGIHSDVDGLFLELCSPRRVEMTEIISSFLDGGSKFVFNRVQFTWDKLNKVSIDHKRGSVDIWQYIGQKYLIATVGQHRWGNLPKKEYDRILNAAAAVCSITGSFNIRSEYETDFESALNKYKGD
jgi:hypothetical protein